MAYVSIVLIVDDQTVVQDSEDKAFQINTKCSVLTEKVSI